MAELTYTKRQIKKALIGVLGDSKAFESRIKRILESLPKPKK